jgi:hypothetical protein
VVVAASYTLRVFSVDGSRPVQDLGFPVVLPTGSRPEQTLIPDLKHHTIILYSIP